MERFPNRNKIFEILWADIGNDFDVPEGKGTETGLLCDEFAQKIILHYRVMKDQLLSEVQDLIYKDKEKNR